MIFRFLTSGESHGKCLTAIIEGVPSGIKINKTFIDNELSRRQCGYGRGSRMKIEADNAEILSGVRHGISIGSPICLRIENKDWQNWQVAMNSDEIELNDANKEIINSKRITKVRPGHADLSGALKYDTEDIRNILERSSARETAARVAAGAVAKSVLKEFNIEILSYVTQIGSVSAEFIQNPFILKEIIENSELRTADTKACELMKFEIDKAKEAGDTLGGTFRVVVKGVPVGLGSHVHWDRKIDGKLAQAIMSIQAVKSVEIGLGKDSASTLGSQTHDEIFYKDGAYFRKTNNAGGIEAGITNGEDIIITADMKAIPTMKKPLKSVCIDTKEQVEAHFERSDTCAVPSCAVVAEAMTAIVIADAFMEKFSHDNIREMKNNYQNFLKYVSER